MNVDLPEDIDDQNPFLNSETIKLLQDLLQSINGRKIARALLRKFKVLSQSYSELGESERKIVQESLSKDFRDQLKALHVNLVSNENSQIESYNSYFDHFWLVLSFCTVILSITFFGYKLYKSLVEKEQKRAQKQQLKQQKKKK